MRTYAPASTEAVLERLLEEPSLARGVIHHEVLPAREAEFAPFPDWVDPRIRRARVARHQRAVHAPGGRDRCRARRAGRGRRHADGVRQDAALRGARPAGDHRGRRVPGALPVPDQGPRPGPGRRADGADKAAGLEVSAATYDGDTPAPIRSAIRTAGRVVVTNPDMLNSAILPHHTKWFQLFEQLKVIVVDELHTYRVASAATSPTSCGGCCGSAPITAAGR